MPSDLFTTGYLGSYAGLVAVTYLLVQFFKEPIQKHFSSWWIRLLAVFIALAIQSFTLYVAGNFTVEAVGLAVLNSFLIAITAAGAHNISQSSTTPIPAVPTSISYYYDSDPQQDINITTTTPAASKTLSDETKDEPPDTQ